MWVPKYRIYPSFPNNTNIASICWSMILCTCNVLKALSSGYPHFSFEQEALTECNGRPGKISPSSTEE